MDELLATGFSNSTIIRYYYDGQESSQGERFSLRVPVPSLFKEVDRYMCYSQLD
jgi:hypothetical protein